MTTCAHHIDERRAACDVMCPLCYALRLQALEDHSGTEYNIGVEQAAKVVEMAGKKHGVENWEFFATAIRLIKLPPGEGEVE